MSKRWLSGLSIAEVGGHWPLDAAGAGVDAWVARSPGVGGDQVAVRAQHGLGAHERRSPRLRMAVSPRILGPYSMTRTSVPAGTPTSCC